MFLATAWKIACTDASAVPRQFLPFHFGLGDQIHNVLELVGIGPKVRAYYEKLKQDCGCDRRRRKLNDLCSYAPPRNRPFLGFCLPHFNDWEGAWATVENILGYAKAGGFLDQIEIVVGDQTPDTPHGRKLAEYLTHVPNARYVKLPPHGSARAKDDTIKASQAEWVCLLDCHATWEPGSLEATMAYLKRHRFAQDLFGGVMLTGTLAKDIYSSHLDRTWQGDTLGKWQHDDRAAKRTAKPFEIENLAGWFLLCRKEAWLKAKPYHPAFRGFGGEEGVMSLAFQTIGRRCLVLPCARAVHRFGRAEGPSFSNDLHDRVRNYAIAFKQFGRDDELDRMRDYFTKQRPDATQTAKGFRPWLTEEFDATIAEAYARMTAEPIATKQPTAKTKIGRAHV